MKDKPTDFQNALAQIPSLESLEVLEKLTYNVCVMPSEDKYRRIKLGNAKIKRTVADVPEALSFLMEHVGWERCQDEVDGEVLILPGKIVMTMNQVRDIQDAQRELKNKERELKRSASAASLKSRQSCSYSARREESESDAKSEISDATEAKAG